MQIGHCDRTQEDFKSAKKLYILDWEEKAEALPGAIVEKRRRA